MKRKVVGKKSFFSMMLIGMMLFTSTAMTTVVATSNDGSATSPFTIAEAINEQDTYENYVRGYIVGQPTSSTQVLKKSFTGDTALALADSPTETDVEDMLFVQVPTQFRSTYGLKSNPSLIGTQVKFKGDLIAYFSQSGLKYVTAAEKISGTTPGGGGTTPGGGGTTPGDGGTTPGDGGTTPGGNTGTTSPYDATYYKSALNLQGSSLKAQLHNIIKDHVEFSYSQVWDALKDTDQDPKNSNNVILLYTGRSQGKSTNGGAPDNWNREHVWAKSHGDFGTSNGAGTDLHHLRPTDVSVNADRGNKDFDMGGATHTEAPGCKWDEDSWEPRNSVKGDVARMIFYMAVRYEGTNGEVDLELNNRVNNGSDPFFGKLSVLLQWNKQDPVDSFEMNRNNVIYNKYQKNRNPFIDHPEWADKIWSAN